MVLLWRKKKNKEGGGKAVEVMVVDVMVVVVMVVQVGFAREGASVMSGRSRTSPALRVLAECVRPPICSAAAVAADSRSILSCWPEH